MVIHRQPISYTKTHCTWISCCNSFSIDNTNHKNKKPLVILGLVKLLIVMSVSIYGCCLTILLVKSPPWTQAVHSEKSSSSLIFTVLDCV